MIIDFFTSPVGIAAILSFFIGSFGYVIARMWIQPLLQYRLIKSRIRSMLHEAEHRQKNSPAGAGGAEKRLRVAAARLSDCYHKTLPQWYQLMITNRGESPDDAVAHLLALANTKTGQRTSKRIAGVKTALRFTSRNKKD